MDTTKDHTRMRRSQNLKYARSAAVEDDHEIVDQTAGPDERNGGEASTADRRGPPHDELRSRPALALMSDA
ncbi:MAG: hypothetical protein ACR2M3_09535 [Thermomicrobiales bacterium]